MHRMKIGLAAAFIILAVTLGFYVSVTGDLRNRIVTQVEAQVGRSQRLFHQIARLDGNDFANLASALAREPGVEAVFDKPEGDARHDAAFDECERINDDLQKQSRKADILALLDSAGRVIARDLNPKAMIGEDLKAEYPSVGIALAGVAAKDIWDYGGRMTRAALAPVRGRDGRAVGALLVGYVVTAKDAQAKRDILGTEVGYFHAGKVHTSSFVAADSGSDPKEDGNKTQALNDILFRSADKPGETALAKDAPTEVFRLRMEGKEYAAVAAPLPGNASDKSSGVVVLKSIDDAESMVAGIGTKVVAFGLFAVLVALAAAVLTAIRFVRPLDKIELGVTEIINGNVDYTFKPVGPDFEGLSNGLNVMLARLLGREEPDEDAVEEEEEARPRWRSDLLVVGDVVGVAGAPGQPSADPAIVALAQEPEANHCSRLFGEYVAALHAKGRPTDGLTVQVFTSKLRLAEGGIRQKWKCRVVRFHLEAGGGDVVVRPIPIY